MQSYIGIDPGMSGGLVSLLLSHQEKRLRTQEVRAIAGDKLSLLETYKWLEELALSTDCFAVIEKVGGFIAGNPLPGSAMFNFGRNYGGLEMALVAACVPYEEVSPRTWQTRLGIPPRGKTESKTDWKRRLKDRAQSLFPKEKVTLAISDALLLAEFCRRKRTGTL
jgi:hypothetical protein